MSTRLTDENGREGNRHFVANTHLLPVIQESTNLGPAERDFEDVIKVPNEDVIKPGRVSSVGLT